MACKYSIAEIPPLAMKQLSKIEAAESAHILIEECPCSGNVASPVLDGFVRALAATV